MNRRFYTLDVFTEAGLEGNPLAVVTDADGLDTERMQAIAREFNLSETVFVLPPHDPVNSARIRIFTPAAELPFAGHPTVGAAVLLAQLHAPEILARQHLALVIEEAIGQIHCIARKVKGATRASFTLPKLPEAGVSPPRDEELAAALGLDPGAIGFGEHRPSVFSAGVAFVFVPVADLAAAAQAWPDQTRWAETFGTIGNVFVYTPSVDRPGVQFRARMFAPLLGIAEDPATGSAVAALAGALMRHGHLEDGDHTIVVEQGVEMGRPSSITLGIDVADGAMVSGSIGGAAVVVSDGTLHL